MKHGRPVSLDPNHTHFILIDDGYRSAFNASVADYRAKLERKIAAPVDASRTVEIRGLGIPVVQVLVEGGFDSIDNVHESVTRGIPVVICQGTGRAADVIAFAFNHHIEKIDGETRIREFPEDYRKPLNEKLSVAFAKSYQNSRKWSEDVFTQKLQVVIDCCKDENMVKLFYFHFSNKNKILSLP